MKLILACLYAFCSVCLPLTAMAQSQGCPRSSTDKGFVEEIDRDEDTIGLAHFYATGASNLDGDWMMELTTLVAQKKLSDEILSEVFSTVAEPNLLARFILKRNVFNMNLTFSFVDKRLDTLLLSILKSPCANSLVYLSAINHLMDYKRVQVVAPFEREAVRIIQANKNVTLPEEILKRLKLYLTGLYPR